MLCLEIENLVLMLAEDADYARIDIGGDLQTEQVIKSLSAPELLAFLQENEVRNVLVNFSELWLFRVPEASDFLQDEFLRLMNSVGVKKVSVVLHRQLMTIMSGVFEKISEENAQNPVRLRFFEDGQFYESRESVSWF